MEKTKKKNYNRAETLSGFLFIIPICLHVLLFVLLPLVFSLNYSFMKYDSFSTPTWIGLANYKDILFGEFTIFWKALGNTLILALGIPIRLFLSLLVAYLLNRYVVRGRGILLVILYIPCVCSTVASSIMWKWIYNNQYGIFNYILSVFGIKGPNWLYDEWSVLPSFILMNIWGGLGTSVIYYLASLQSQSKEVIEAAELDGANAAVIFFKITLPAVSPITFYLIITGLINALQGFNQTYVMTPNGGTNNSSTTVVFLIWKKAFGGAGEMGYASAMAWLLGLIIFLITFVQFKGQKRWVHESD